MNLREVCRLEGFPTAVLTTFTFDPLFFERIVLQDLLAGGTEELVVLADAGQAIPALHACRDQVHHLGRKYRLLTVDMAGAFHPKICVRLSATGSLIACGSGNLTRAGWLGVRKDDSLGGNREIGAVWNADSGSPEGGDVARALSELRASLDPAARGPLDEVLRRHAWVADAAGRPRPADRHVVVVGPSRTLATVLEERWRGRRFDRLVYGTGSTDDRGAMIRWATRVFGVHEAVVAIDPLLCGLAHERLADLPCDLRVLGLDPSPRSHMKFALFEGGDGPAAVFGSANCSAAAWLAPATEGGNVEAVVILDRCDADQFRALVAADWSTARAWREVEFAGSSERVNDAGRPTRTLRSLVLSQQGQRLEADVEAPAGATVSMEIDGRTFPAHPAGKGRWIAQVALEQTHRTRFGRALVGPAAEPTNTVWVDDMGQLDAMRRHHQPWTSVGNLGDPGSGADPRATLRDVALLSELLLRGGEDDAPSAVRGQDQDEQAAEAPAKPVTTADLLRSLDDLGPRGRKAGVTHAPPGVTLAGVMRLLFGLDTRPQDALDITAEERSKVAATGGTDSEQDDKPDGGTAESTERTADKADRRRLRAQVERFLDRFGSDEFAERVTARQLQQAAAFPLGLYLLSLRGRWVSSGDDRLAWARVVSRTCEILLSPRHTKAGMAPSLLERVAARYRMAGQAQAFDVIIGDGTLWLLVLAALTRAGDANDPFERNLALRDVAENETLRAVSDAAGLSALIEAMSVRLGDEQSDWLARVRVAHSYVSSLIARLRTEIGSSPKRCSGAPRIGDWLWNTEVGFARIEGLDSAGSAAVHIRSKAKTVPNVGLRFYTNLRLAPGLTTPAPVK